MRRGVLVALGLYFLLLRGGGAWIAADYLGWNPRTWSRLVTSACVGVTLVAIGWWPQSRTGRVVLGALGLAAAIFALACVTGGWLGTAPWQLREVDAARWARDHFDWQSLVKTAEDSGGTIIVRDAARRWEATLFLGLTGLAFLAVAAWPRYVWVERPDRVAQSA